MEVNSTKDILKEIHRLKREERSRTIASIVKANEHCNTNELLNWAMNQLFRAARQIDLMDLINNNHHVSMGCDATATVILNRLASTVEGYSLIEETNPILLEGYPRPK